MTVAGMYSSSQQLQVDAYNTAVYYGDWNVITTNPPQQWECDAFPTYG
jgi:hypothetical protein